MKALAWESMDWCAECFDFIRSRLLRLTMKLAWARPFFYKRPLRLALLFTISCATSLPLAIFFPLWLLLFGPLVYGVPHIVSSLRYFHHSAESASNPRPERQSKTQALAFSVAGMILMAVFVHRLLLTQSVFNISVPHLSEWKGSTYVDLIALGITFILGSWIYRKTLGQFLAGAALLAPLVLAFWREPMWTIGAMVLIHNFIAFIYWIRSTKSGTERLVAWTAFSVTFIISAAIFFGLFDGIYGLFHSFQPRLALNVAQLTAEDTGRLIAPWWQETSQESGQGSNAFWLHACSVYAFGQALHYFVWLKAIPDQFHSHDVPTTFRQSLRLLGQDFGRTATTALVLISVASVVIWSFMTLQEARMIYFCLAGYHGYLEIAGLALSLRPVSIKLPFLSPKNPSALPCG